MIFAKRDYWSTSGTRTGGGADCPYRMARCRHDRANGGGVCVGPQKGAGGLRRGLDTDQEYRFSRTFGDKRPYKNNTWPILSRSGCCIHGGFSCFSRILAAPAGSRLDHFFLNVDCLTVFLETTAATASCPSVAAWHDGSTAAIPGGSLTCLVSAGPSSANYSASLLLHGTRVPATDLSRSACQDLLRPYRATSRLHNAHEAIGSSLGGEPGSRLTVRLAIATSPDTLLRRVKQLEGESAAPPRIVGIDDWAWRKGRRYGTIVVDLERGDVIDLLPDRDTTTVKKWLDEHPESNSSVAIARRLTLKQPPNRRQKPSKSLIVGTC